jgi:hypothetical protein
MLIFLFLLPWIARADAVTDVNCVAIPGSTCAAELCLLEPTGGYSRPTVWIAVPRSPVQRLRIHLHGWTQHASGQALNPSFDFAWSSGKAPDARDVLKMVMAYGIHRDVCEPDAETVLMPLSRGHVDDYRSHFKTPADLTRWKNAVTGMIRATGTGVADSDLPWTLSAHSGGGAIAARSIDPEGLSPDRVILLDATYDSTTAVFFQTWLTRNRDLLRPRTLEVVSVTAPTAKHSRTISLTGRAETDGFTRTVRTPTATLVREIRNDLKFDHYSIVPARWDIGKRRP